MKNPIAKICTEHGTIVVELYPQNAPNSVASFVKMANEGLYAQRRIRRIVPGFVLQPSYSAFEDPRCDFMIAGEYAANGFDNPTPFMRGTVALAGDGNLASGSEFFITLSDEAGERLCGRFSAFGKVIDGWDELERLEHLPLRDVKAPWEGVTIKEPAEPEIMLSVTVEPFDYMFAEPVIWEEK